MKPSDIAKLAAGFAAGSITTSAIQEEYGDDILSQVLDFGGGTLVGTVVAEAMDFTGVSDFLDDLF
jgi:hypothetical protein